jgi:hypothetical protein
MEQYIDFIKIEPCDPDGGVSSHIGTTQEGAEYLIPDDLWGIRSRNLQSHPNREQEMLKAWDADAVIENV